MSCNYCWNQPIKHGKYDLYLDGKITANEIVYKVLTENKETENINLADKVQEIESRLQTHFEFKTVEVLPDVGEETVIYLVANDDKSGDKDGYNEYMWVKEKGEFELIGSGTYAQQQADLQAEIDRASAAEQVLTENLANEETARTNADNALDEKIENRVVINDPITITEGDNTTSITSDTISTTTLTGTLDAESMKNSLTAEAIQNVAPIAWGEWATTPKSSPKHSITIGDGAETNNEHGITIGSYASGGGVGVCIGYAARTAWLYGTAIGRDANAGINGVAISGINSTAMAHAVSIGSYSLAEIYGVAIGESAKAKKKASVTIGAQFTETTDSGNVEHTCTTEGTGSITIGAGANTLNNGDIESSNSVTIGCKAENKGADSVVIGAYANNPQSASVVIGGGARSNGNRTVAVGQDSIVAPKSVAVGYYARAHQDFSLALGSNSDAAANNTIVIGYGATVTNTGDTQSENTTVIGYGATASAPNAVVLGAGASNSRENSVVIGVGAKALDTLATIVGCNATATTNASAMGHRATASFHSIAIGHYAHAKSVGGIAIGNNSNADKHALSIGSSAQSTSHNAIAIGTNAKANDIGATVIRSTAEDNTITQLYFSGQNTPLALKYYPTEWEKKQDVDEQGNPKVDDEGNPIMIDDKDKPTKGQAMMGYVVSKVITNDEGKQETKVVECGTNLLAALFPNHGLGDNPFQPTTTAIDGEEIMSFHPSDLDLPIEEPTDDNDVEINIPTIETPIEEEYKPLPVYPIVEPTIEEITE